MDLFLKPLACEDWIEVYQATVETKYDVFFSIFSYAFETSFPKVTVTEKI